MLFALLFAFADLWNAAVAQSPADERSPAQAFGQSRERQRDYVEYLKKQVAADPDNRQLQLELGRAYYSIAITYDTAAIAEAEKVFDRVLAAEDQNAVALAYRGALQGLKLGFRLVSPDRSLATLRQSSED